MHRMALTRDALHALQQHGDALSSANASGSDGVPAPNVKSLHFGVSPIVYILLARPLQLIRQMRQDPAA